MTTDPRAHDTESMGGRLRLLAPVELDADQKRLHQRLIATRGVRGTGAGYRISLDDGRLIGPFNALLRIPAVGERQLDWAEAISSSGVPPAVREVIILTVAAEWEASYVLYAHVAAARAVGLSDDAIDDLVHGRNPRQLDDASLLAHRAVRALVKDKDIPDDIYASFVSYFGERGAVALITIVGQYLATCAAVCCFRAPAPGPEPSA